eukprot:SAG11_NODE_600_length_8259_cov_6.574510_9_plen_62_part_00
MVSSGSLCGYHGLLVSASANFAAGTISGAGGATDATRGTRTAVRVTPQWAARLISLPCGRY